MATEIELALLAYSVYGQSGANQVSLASWLPNESLTRATSSGFAASVYAKGNEVVIAFRGTDDPQLQDYLNGNIPAAAGEYSPQIMEAIQLVADAMAANPGKTITLTGHSLGGGLASVMSSLFGLQAVVFDPAPFGATAYGAETVNSSPPHIVYGGLLQTYFDSYVSYQQSQGRGSDINSLFNGYVTALSSTDAAVRDAMYAQRALNVTGYFLQDEALTAARAQLPMVMAPGGLTQINIGSTTLNDNPITSAEGATDAAALHDMSLLLAMMASSELRAASAQLPTLIQTIIDPTLYFHEDNSGQTNFLNRLLQDQVRDGVNTSGKALDKFADDVKKLGGDYGVAQTDAVRDALIIAAIEYYNFKDLSEATSLFTVADGGIHFKYSDIGATEYNSLPKLAEAVAIYGDPSDPTLLTRLRQQNAWHIQSGTGALLWSADASDPQDDVAVGGVNSDSLGGGAGNDILMGFAGNDGLDGGDGADRLYGYIGNDVLIGGKGDDYLYGGADFDTYQFTAGDGFDLIKGNDNDGQIVVNGITLTGADAQRSRTMLKTWYWHEGGVLFLGTLIPEWVGTMLSYDNPALWVRTAGGSVSVLVEDYATGDLGLLLSSTQQNATPSAPNKMIQKIQDQVDNAQRMPARVDPIILDLDGDGVETLHVSTGIHFDHDANGFAETTGWVGADDGLLVRDLNSNGLIDSGVELFGNNVLLADGSYAEHGFEALAELDSNGDGKLSSADTAFSELRIWKDANGDGITDAGELLTLSAAGVQSISTPYANGVSTDVNGNQHLQTGAYITTGGATRQMDDVWFAADWSDTVNTTTVTVSAEVEVLPDVAGFGNVASLHQAMMLDTSGHLQSLVTSYAAETDAAARASLLQQIIFAWTEVESMAPNSRGSNVADARTVYALEAFLGEPFVMSDGSTTPTANAATQLLAAYNELAAYINGQLLAQTHLQSLYEGMVLALSADESSISWNVSGVVTQLQSVYDLDAQAGLELLNSLVSSLKTNEESGSAMLAALRGAGDLDTTGLMRELALAGFDSSILGTSGNDVLNGGATDELVIGLDGNDTLSGNGGDDVLDGGVGNDALTGGEGSDVYVFGYGSGQDVIGNYDLSTGRVDALELGAGIMASDIVLLRSGNDLIVKLADTTDQVTVTNYFLSDTTAGYALDEFRFADGTVWSQSDINSFYLSNAGTEEADTLSSFAAGSVLHGRGGNDMLTGGAGADSLYGDAGNDVISAGAGNDVVEGGEGNDTLNGGAGQNTYRFGVGDGTDAIIYNYDSSTTKSNVLSFKEGVLPSGIVATRSGDDLVLTLAGTADSVRVQRFFYGDNPLSNNYSPVQQVSFADGTVWVISDLVAKVFGGTVANDTIVGTINADTINGSSGNDSLYGRTGNDTLNGGDGNDSLYGEAGDDVFIGGLGNDNLYATGGNDIFIFNSGDGHDTLSGGHGSAETATLQFGTGVSLSDIVIKHDSYSDMTLNIAGSDDNVSIKNVSSVPTTNVPAAQSRIVTTVEFSDGTTRNLAYVMQSGVTSLSLDDVQAIVAIGNELDNTIVGTAGSNSLVSGKGVDTLSGEGGDDVYVVDAYASWWGTNVFYSWGDSQLNNFQDIVTEGVGQGNDTIYAYNVYSAILSSNVENLIIDGCSNVTISFNLTQDVRRKFIGNELNNVIDARNAQYVGVGIGYVFSGNGAGGEIVLDGGMGADTLIGPAGLKTRYVVDNVGDVVVAGSGITTVESYIDYTLAPTFNNLTLAGTAAITGIGNALNNIINGEVNSTGNLLVGGSGNDTYIVGAGDTIQESSDSGIDTVQTTLASYTLGANLENLTLTGQYSAARQNGTGNVLDNVIKGTTYIGASIFYYYGNNILTGDAGNDILWGEGQNDTLNGGDGNDILHGDSSSLAVTLHGNDYLNGGSGDDQLYGFSGDDIYAGFSETSGQDVISDSDGSNDRIQFAVDANVDVESMQFSRVGDDLQMALDAANGITIKSWYTNTSNAIESMTVYKGWLSYTYTAAQIQGRADSVNTGPIAIYADTRSGRTNEELAFQLASNTFSDIESQFSLSYEAKLSDGSDLPPWLAFDSSTRTFIGTPPADSIGTFTIQITATDAGGLSASTTFDLVIEQGAVFGTEGDDMLTGDSSDNILYGLGGNDVLNGQDGYDELYGGEGNDTYYGGASDDYLDDWDGGGDDILYGEDGIDEMYGGYGNDTYYGGAGDDYMDDWDTDGNDYMDGGSGSDEMWAGLGNDIYIVDNTGDFVGEELDQGVDEVRSSITYTLSDNVENLTLTGSSALSGTGNALDNVLTGNSGSNTLTALDGNDTLDGGSSGTDNLRGGLGNDTYIVARTSGITITENASEGTDLVKSSVTYTLGNNLENLTLTGTSAINGTGNALDNIIVGNSGNNTLSGAAGADTMIGGSGNDTYVVDNMADVVTENANEGTDLVQSSVTYTVGVNVENLTLTGSSAINGMGNVLNNTINGNGGNNIIDGGVGVDTMIGGAGNDTYVVDNAGDIVTESSNSGTDLVQASISYTLGSNIENLTLTGAAAINGTGNTLANMLTGNSADNTLSGGTGADTMLGGLGNDTYVVDNTSDVVTENTNEGADLIQSSVAYTLGNNVENLTLAGTSAINGTGNALDNILTGNSGNNTLTGNAGNDTLDGAGGTDTMTGGAGNDIYYVDVSADVTTENANEGIDLVNSAITRTLGSNIELLFLTGTSAINGTGNTLANLLRGNTGNNTLAGGGGTDILEGGAGTDTLSNTSGNTLLNGGAGTDTLTGTSNNDLLIGGTGNDALTTGTGADIIAFNKGDGQDTIVASTTKDNTLSIGGGTLYADLLFQKSGNNLILKVGASDQITFTNYYSSTSNRSVNKLQVVLEGSSDYNAGSSDALYNKKIETFDFGGLVSAFDAALAANPSLTTWALTNALVSQYLSGSDTAAMGGDLAYQYGRYSSLSNISFTPALGVLSSSSFGTSAQTLQPLASLQDSSQRLS